MDNEIRFDYYYGNEAEQFSFYRIPRILIKDERFKGISNDAKLLYGLMLDRMSLSIKNGWFDDENRAYIHYTMDNAMDDLGCAKEKCCKIFKELDNINGIGLIEKKRQGLGKPDIIYVKNFISGEVGDGTKTGGENIEPQEVRKSNFKNYDSDIDRSSEIEIQGSVELSEVRKSNFLTDEDHTSRGSKIELQEVRETNGNYNNNNYTDFSYNNINQINPINQTEEEKQMDGYDVMDEVSAYMELIKENIEYDHNIRYSDRAKREYWEEIFNLICDVVCVKRKTVRIGGEEYPYELVKSRFLKLKDYHVNYVIDCVSKMTEKITNMKSYLITALYNAPSTANMYTQNEVQNDLYGGHWNEQSNI